MFTHLLPLPFPLHLLSVHAEPRTNYGLFLTWLDERYGTYANPERHAPSLLLLATAVAFYIPVLSYVEAAIRSPWTFAVLVLLHAATPLARPLTALLSGVSCRWSSRLALWDRMRADLLITYAPPGTSGAFEPKAGRRYIFCYQPMGVQARGAWYTFACKGRGSPVAGLANCRLAVLRDIWLLPGVQQALALVGCCGASYAELRRLLTMTVRWKCGCLGLGT
jgi:hypothetical protein